MLLCFLIITGKQKLSEIYKIKIRKLYQILLEKSSSQFCNKSGTEHLFRRLATELKALNVIIPRQNNVCHGLPANLQKNGKKLKDVTKIFASETYRGWIKKLRFISKSVIINWIYTIKRKHKNVADHLSLLMKVALDPNEERPRHSVKI